MPRRDIEYEDLGADLSPQQAEEPADGEPWEPGEPLVGLPEEPTDQPPETGEEPRFYGEELGLPGHRPLVLVPGIGATRLERWEAVTTPSGATKRLRKDEVWPLVNPARAKTNHVPMHPDRNAHDDR